MFSGYSYEKTEAVLRTTDALRKHSGEDSMMKRFHLFEFEFRSSVAISRNQVAEVIRVGVPI